MGCEGGEPISIFTGEIEAFGGAERSLLALAKWLAGQGIANEIVTYQDRAGLEQYASHPVKVVQLRPDGGVRAKVRALRRYAAGRGGACFLASGYQAALHTTLAGVRGFNTLMHDTAALIGDAPGRSLQGRLRVAVSNYAIGFGLRSGGVTLVTSEFLRQECWKDFHVRARIARMGGLATIQFRERPFDGQLRIFSVSRVEANKRIDWLLEALAALEREAVPLSSNAEWSFVVAGKGSELEAMRARATALGLAGRVSFRGFVTDAELAELYGSAQLFLMPARQGYGIPAVEALQAGIPVLVHRESGVSDVLLDTPWATVATGGPAEMVTALREAISSVMAGRSLGWDLPALQTEDGWADEVARSCGWLRRDTGRAV